MAYSINKVTLLGNVGNEPEIRFTQSGDCVATFSVATSEKWKSKQGEDKERTEWHRVVVFGKLAEIVDSYVRKGSKIYLEGQNQTRKWTDQSGVDRYTTEVVLKQFNGEIVLLDSEQKQARPQPQQQAQQPQAQKTEYQQQLDDYSKINNDFDDDIPF